MFCRNYLIGFLIIAVSVGLILSLFFGGCGTVLLAIFGAIAGLIIINNK